MTKKINSKPTYIISEQSVFRLLWWLKDKTTISLEKMGLYPILYNGQIWYSKDKVETILNEKI